MLREVAAEALDFFHTTLVYPYLTSGKAKGDREISHERSIRLMQMLLKHPQTLERVASYMPYNDPILALQFGGVVFPNPVGLAGGFDKNAEIYPVLGALGFGHVEVGTITKIPYRGNPRPRIDDLPDDLGLNNSMGFPGKGTQTAIDNFSKIQDIWHIFPYALGVSIGASRPSFDRGTVIQDSAYAHRKMAYGDYVVSNISSPNTIGIRGLQEPSSLDPLLSAHDKVRDELKEADVLFLLKFSPDIPAKQWEETLRVVLDHNVDGIIVGNTTIDPRIAQNLSSPDAKKVGGKSGEPLRTKALEVNRSLTETLTKLRGGEKLLRIGAGGIQNARHAWEMISYGGVDLVQVYSGFVMPHSSTPNFPYYLNSDLAIAARMDGLTNIRQLKGSEKPYPLAAYA